MDELGGLRVGSASVPEHGPRGAVLVGGEETGGRFALVETVEERGAEPPRHLHHWEDEALYVLEGSLNVWIAGGWGTAMALLEGREHLFSPDFGQGTPLGLWQLILTGLVFSAGYILLGSANARARVLPRGAGILLAVGGPIVAFSPPIGLLPVFIVGHALLGLGLAWAGYALWKDAELERSLSG